MPNVKKIKLNRLINRNGKWKMSRCGCDHATNITDQTKRERTKQKNNNNLRCKSLDTYSWIIFTVHRHRKQPTRTWTSSPYRNPIGWFSLLIILYSDFVPQHRHEFSHMNIVFGCVVYLFGDAVWISGRRAPHTKFHLSNSLSAQVAIHTDAVCLLLFFFWSIAPSIRIHKYQPKPTINS